MKNSQHSLPLHRLAKKRKSIFQRMLKTSKTAVGILKVLHFSFFFFTNISRSRFSEKQNTGRKTIF